MADVRPFRGWRYELKQVGNLSDVTAPPYDVIDSQQQDDLYKQHPCNVIRLILNRDEPGDSSTEERYTRAATFLKDWQRDGVLTQERDDAIYVYHQVFDWEGTNYVRKGFLARLRLEEFGKGHVYPHEQTMPGPKADRLALLNACRMNLSAIFGLYPDPECAGQAPLEEAIAGQTPMEAVDELGVVHRMWAVTDAAVINQVREALREQPIFIADGHHRYETALNFQKQLQESGEISGDDDPANFVMMMFVGMNDPGLAILPTHRLVSGLPDLTADDVKQALGNSFSFEQLENGAAGAEQAWELMQADSGQGVFGLGTAADGAWLFARITDHSPMEQLAEEQSPEWRELGVSLLHRLIIDNLLANHFSGSEPKCTYVHRMDEVNSALGDRTVPLACLVAPAGIEHVETIASKYEKMPPKSTFFYPKLLTGLVLNPLN